LKKALKLVLVSVAILGLCVSRVLAQSDPEARILNYIRDHLKAGQPVEITALYNNVFTAPADRKALDKLYKDFFRIPMFIVRYQEKFSKPPSLKIIAQQFALKKPEEADILLRIMESDPRVPKFITRSPKTGEITHVDVAKIRGDPRFGEGAVHRLGGWQGRAAPAFDLAQLVGSSHMNSAELGGKVILLYVWFTGCPPCMKEAPGLVALQQQFGSRGFTVLGANADDMLGMSSSKRAHHHYLLEENISFPVVRWTHETDQAYGDISIYPTLFLINRKGIIVGHWVGYTTPAVLRQAITKAVAK
jgi:thiol-disulfide isomerase/thioredoxin